MLTDIVRPTQAQIAARIYSRNRPGRRDLGPRGFSVQQKPGTSARNLDRLDALLGALELEGDDPSIEVDVDAERPRVRGDCVNGPRPCPFVSCRHHLALDINESGSLKVVDNLDLEAMADTCSLDVADRGEHTLDQVGQFLNVTRERTRQLETKALFSAQFAAKTRGIEVSELALVNHTKET